jgi:hypothetical protein
MTNAPTACPYCNTLVTVAPGLANGQRVECPRCGESFALRRSKGEGEAEQHSASAHPAFEPSRPRPSRAIGLAVLGLMVLAAAAGLTLALFTQKDRREHDTGKAKRPKAWPPPVEVANEGPVAPLAPARLPALGYLPDDTTLLAGVRLAEVLGSETGKELLANPLKVGETEFRLTDLEGWTGLRPEELDHVVVGARLDVLPPRVTLVARTRRPYDPSSILAALKAGSASGGKGAYAFEVPNVPLKPELRFLDARTLAVGVFPGSLDAVSPRPRTGINHLSDELRYVLQERMKPGGPLWFAGTISDEDRKKLAQLLAEGKKEYRDVLTRLKTFGTWMELEPDRRFYVVVEAKSGADAEALANLLPKPADYPQSKTAREGAWLTLQLTTNLDGVRRALSH